MPELHWPTTLCFLLLAVVAIGLVVLALWLLPIELRAGPVELTRP